MKKLPSILFPGCEFSAEKDVGFYDIIPTGFNHEVSIYLSAETVADDEAVKRAAAFFDNAAHWDDLCRRLFLSFDEESEDYETVVQYFDFFKDEAPEVFGEEDVSELSLEAMVSLLTFDGMAAHEGGLDEENYVVDFTLGFDQILCVEFDSESNIDYISWES